MTTENIYLNIDLLEYKGEQSSAPSSPQKDWFYKNTVDGVMYYFDGTNWIAYAEGGGGGGGIIFIERSLPDLHVDITNNALVPGVTYKITGVHKAHTVNGISVPALYDDGQDLGITIFLKAISENELETFGTGVFYNPRYDKQVQGFGIWSVDKTYNVDDVVFWGGYAWKNLTGNTGADTDVLNLNGDWEKIPYTDEDYYNRAVDYIEYDIENDVITRRHDTANNIDVSSVFYDISSLYMEWWFFNPISLMQWGNDLNLNVSTYETVGVGNISVKHTSFVELINFKGEFINNVTFDNKSRLSDANFDNGSYLNNVTFDNGSYLNNANFDNGSYLNNVTFDNGSFFEIVTFDNGSFFEIVTFDNDSYLNNVVFDNGSYLNKVTFDNGSRFQGSTFDNGSYLNNVVFDNFSTLTNVDFVNSNMSYNTFINFRADFNPQTYTNLQFSNIKFEGNGIPYTIPDISSSTIITNSNIPQKKVFGIDANTQKIQYWDSVNNDFVVANITD